MNDVINSLIIIDLYLINLYYAYPIQIYLKFLFHTLLLDVYRMLRKIGKKINITEFQKVEFFFVCVIKLYIYTLFLKLFSIMVKNREAWCAAVHGVTKSWT